MQEEHAASVTVGALAGKVRSLMGYSYEDLQPGEHLGLPSTTITFVLPIDDELDLTFAGRRRTLPIVVGGLHSTAARIHHGTRQHGVQLAIDPLACRALLGVPAAEIADQVVDLGEIWGRRASALRDRAHSATTLQQQCSVVTSAILPREPISVRRELIGAWSLIQKNGGLMPIAEIAQQIGWSRRYLEAQFRIELGISPKQASRIRRFERAVKLVRAHDLAEAAAQAGFSDQPHMNRDWRELAGTSPNRWREEDRLAFVQDAARKVLEGRSHD